jgi:chitin synthase
MILSFSGIMLVPVLYYVSLVLWCPRGVVGRVQYILGLLIYLVCGPFLNLFVLAYALYNMDSFNWGKTRKVVETAVAAEVTENKESRGRGMVDEEAAIGIAV